MQPPGVNPESHVDVKPRNAAVLILFTFNSTNTPEAVLSEVEQRFD